MTRDGIRRGTRRPLRRAGFSLLELLVALTLLTGVLLGFTYFSTLMTHTNQNVAARALASDLVGGRLEQIKGNRNYTTLVATYNSVTETWPTGNIYNGFTRVTYVTRTNNATNDFVTITVAVSGRGLSPVMRRTTSIAAY